MGFPTEFSSEGCLDVSTRLVGTELQRGHSEDPSSTGFLEGFPRLVLEGRPRKVPEKVNW